MDKTSEQRMNKMIEAIMKVARGDYSVQVDLSGMNDELDSLAMGINMMMDDLVSSTIKTDYVDIFWQIIMGGENPKSEMAMYWNDKLQIRLGAEYRISSRFSFLAHGSLQEAWSC